MDCCRRVNPFRACSPLRGLGYLMLAFVAAIVAVSYYAVVVYTWGPLLLGGGAAAGAAAVLVAFHLLQFEFQETPYHEYTAVQYHCASQNLDTNPGTKQAPNQVGAGLQLAMIIWCYLMVVFTDPGAVPENWRHASEEDGIGVNSRTISYNWDATYPNPEGQSAQKYCSRCQNGKPPRCHHCSVYTFVETVLDTLVLLPYFIEFFRDESRRSSSPGDIAILFVTFVLNLAFALSLLCFIGMHASLVTSNTTSIEVHERRNSVSWKYDLGWRKNLEQVFGTKKLLWFLPLYSAEDLHNIGALHGLEFPTRSDAVV
uniref:Protein S-acyltransferase n=1 Tax=Oryza rufipogon TaxID=4529 RepID=A0A0E0Q7Y8_ORYRU